MIDVFNVLDDYSSQVNASGSYLATNREAIETCFAGKESIMDIMEALQAHGSEWSLGTLTKMKEKLSPTSLVITLREVGVVNPVVYIYIFLTLTPNIQISPILNMLYLVENGA